MEKLQRRMSSTGLAATVVLIAALGATTARAETVVESLVESCRATGRDPAGRPREASLASFCLGYVQAFKDAIAFRGETTKFCIPKNLSHGEQVLAFAAWADAQQERARPLPRCVTWCG